MVLRCRARKGDQSHSNGRIELRDEEVHILARMLGAGWLNTGLRNPKAFGLLPCVMKEMEFEGVFFESARILFEHVLMMQRLPGEGSSLAADYNLEVLNSFIEQQATSVFVFFTRLVNVDCSDLDRVPSP